MNRRLTPIERLLAKVRRGPVTGVCMQCGFVAELDTLDEHTARCDVDPVAKFWAQFDDCPCGVPAGEKCPGDLPHADRPRLVEVAS